MRRLAVLATGGLIILLLVLAQLILPGIAEQQLRDRLSKNGQVLTVQVSAFPAIELLWHQADKVVVRLASYRSGTSHLSGLLDESSNVGSLDASAGVLTAGLLKLRNATLTKHDDRLVGSAQITQSDLRSSIPILDGVQLVSASANELTLRGTATVFGVTASVNATLGIVGGGLVVQPDVPFGSLAAITVFKDPHVRVQSISATGTSGGFAVAAAATLR